MRILLFIIAIACAPLACNTKASAHAQEQPLVTALPPATDAIEIPADTIKPGSLEPYSGIEFEKKEFISAATGTKSVVFNTRGTRLYAMNLEGMSVYEFDQASRKIIREFTFKPTKGTGWDYEKDKPIPSFEEKPVEACLSHDDKILWVSLHNAEGIVPIPLDTVNAILSPDNASSKKIYVSYPGNSIRDSLIVPLIKTGKTPKIISRTADSKYLLVSNWHSYNVSVLQTDEHISPFARVIGTIPVSSIPRGIAVDDLNNRSYVAIMGGASIAVINNTAWMKVANLEVASNPRHIVLDSAGRLYVSYNRIGRIACVDGLTGKTLFTAKTAAQPRTIMLSKNQKFLFTTCYSSDTVEVFRITDNAFSKVISLPCKGHPVGVDIFEDNDKLEAWVCSYTNGAINIFSFRKKDWPRKLGRDLYHMRREVNLNSFCRKLNRTVTFHL